MVRGHVLVVDDQPDIRLLVRSWLSCEGYEVSESASGQAVLAALEGGDRPDVIVLDNELGEALRGVELAPLFKHLAPSTRIVMFSAAIATDTPLDAVDRTLNKIEPVTTLAEVVGLLMAERAGATPISAA